ncbi:MAG: DUF4962 domain-containing protein, partial [Planctomycetes bacterium]|nr:DUF4962 domain-containing protein [Planctomycetota bacterium]
RDGKGHCLKIHNTEPGTACPLILKGPIEVKKNLILSFWHREEVEKGYEGSYLGMGWFVNGKQAFWCSDKFSSKWKLTQVQIGKLKGHWGVDVKLGLKLSKVQLYGRVKEKTKKRGETKARITVWFDDIRLFTGYPKRTLSERTRESYSNPPLLNWRKEEEGNQKVQYSLDPTFPEGESTTVDVKWNFYTPPKPLKPGTWYWRVWSDSELSEGWSEVEQVVVPPNVHDFTTEPIPVDQVLKMPRPRLLGVAKIGQPELTEKRKAALKKSARKLREWPSNQYRAVPGNVPAPEKTYTGPDGKPIVLGRTGVQVHPGPHVKGDKRWPTWIDWYGKVAGGITGRTGRKLQRIAQYAMLTQDPEVIQWAKEMAIMACMWDPAAGSAMHRGDIGAHHLLRGLSWCYDVCRDGMTPAERELMQKIIVQRAMQFYDRLNPFRGHEANNHAWLQAFGVSEAGLVLLGDYDRAAEWAEYVRQLYLGRFLCCLGYQGDNNEGLSYWSYGLMFIVDYADELKAVTGIDLYKHPWLAQTARFVMYNSPPNGWWVSFADSGMPNHGARKGPSCTRRVRDLALRTRDPYALWYSGERETVDGITPKPPVDLPQSIHYRHIGWVVFNTSIVDGRDDVTVAMHSGTYFAGHQHPDQNSFVINAYGEKLAIDGGYYDWYGSPHFKAYSSNTLAHNTLLVNGEGQAARKKGTDGKVLTYFDSPGYGYTVGDASDPDIYKGLLKQFDRRILFIKPGFVVIHDLVASAKGPAKYDWMMHAIAPIKVDDSRKSFALQRENAALRGRFFAPANVGLKVSTGFPVEPVNRYSTDPVPKEKYFPEWHLYATPAKPAVEDEFLAAMQIQRLGAEAEPEARFEKIEGENCHAVRLECGDRTHLVLLRKRGAEGVLKADGLESDGEAAAIEIDASGNIRRSLAIKATFLRFKGKAIVEGEKSNWSTLDRPDLKSGPIKGTWVSVNGKKSKLLGYERRLPDTMLRDWWGRVELPQSDRYTIALDGWTGNLPPRLKLGDKEIELKNGKTTLCWLKEGSYAIEIAGKGTLKGLTITGEGVKLIPAKMLPKDFKPAKGSLIIEAERTSAGQGKRFKIMKKVAASGGKAHCCWDTEGDWAEWTFDVATAGDYELLIRGASEHSMILRELKLDGKPLAADIGVVRLEGTGGWCRTKDDWRTFAVVDSNGAIARIPLTAGKHTLRMDQRGGSMNLDILAWQPAK